MFQGGTTQLICKWRFQNGCHYLESKLRIFVWGVRIVLLYVKCIMMDILMSNTNSAPKKMNFDSSLIFVWYCLLSQFAEDECKRFECKCNIVLMSNLVFVSSIYRKDVVKYTTGNVAFSKHVVSISLLCWYLCCPICWCFWVLVVSLFIKTMFLLDIQNDDNIIKIVDIMPKETLMV